MVLTRDRLWREQNEINRRLNSGTLSQNAVQEACRQDERMNYELYTVNTDLEVVLGRMVELAAGPGDAVPDHAPGAANGARPGAAPAAARRSRRTR